MSPPRPDPIAHPSSPRPTGPLWDYLIGFLTPHRFTRLEQVVAQRTRFLTLAVESVYHCHNLSAVFRTCDAFGIQDVHIIDNPHEPAVNPEITLGTDQWLTLRHFSAPPDGTRHCYQHLRQRGYQILATTPHGDSISVDDFRLDRKSALIIGNERDGLSPWALENADVRIHLPMFGFVESFNLSVTAAILLASLTRHLRTPQFDWHLSDAEKVDLLQDWIRKSIREIDLIEQRYFQQHPAATP